MVAAIEGALAGRIAAPTEPEVQPSPFGDGNAAARVVDALAWRLLPDHARPTDFVAPAIGAGPFSPTP